LLLQIQESVSHCSSQVWMLFSRGWLINWSPVFRDLVVMQVLVPALQKQASSSSSDSIPAVFPKVEFGDRISWPDCLFHSPPLSLLAYSPFSAALSHKSLSLKKWPPPLLFPSAFLDAWPCYLVSCAGARAQRCLTLKKSGTTMVLVTPRMESGSWLKTLCWQTDS